MTTVFIAGVAVPLPSRFALGEVAPLAAVQFLNDLQHRRIKTRLRYLLDRGEIAPNELQKKADELAALDLVPYITTDDGIDDDPILAEALTIARELIIGRMAKEGLLPPKGLDIHAKALVDAMPEIQERARLRVEARFAAANESLGDLQ